MPADVPSPRRRAAFLDRDGVLNYKHPDLYYVLTPDQLQLLPGAAPGLKLLAAAGFRLFVVTNQRAVARGLLNAAALAALHAQMERELGSAGVVLDAIYVCPHDEGACDCRNPPQWPIISQQCGRSTAMWSVIVLALAGPTPMLTRVTPRPSGRTT